MLANNCFFFDNQGGFFSVNDTKVSIKSIKKEPEEKHSSSYCSNRLQVVPIFPQG